MKVFEYNIRIQIDADKEDMVYRTNVFVDSKQLARALIQESNFATVQKRVDN